MKIRIFCVLVLLIFFIGCQNSEDNNGGVKNDGEHNGAGNYYFCESSTDCWGIENFECSLDNINLDPNFNEINETEVEQLNFNQFYAICHNNKCYCQGVWYTLD